MGILMGIVRHVLGQAKAPATVVADIVAKADKDGDGYISVLEVLETVMARGKCIRERRVK